MCKRERERERERESWRGEGGDDGIFLFCELCICIWILKILRYLDFMNKVFGLDTIYACFSNSGFEKYTFGVLT